MTTQNTTTQAATVAFKDATPAEQQARLKAVRDKQLQIIADAGLENPVVLHGYIAAFMVKETLTAKNGTPGKHYLLNVYADGKDNFFHIYTYAKGIMARYDRMVALKQADMKSKAHKLTGTVLAGTNPKSKSNRLNVATVFIDKNKQN